jgi:hypothetical protein
VGSHTGSYSFRLGELSAATTLVPGTPVSGSLDPAIETDLYRFDAAAGERFFFDVQARSGAINATWRLIDPYGNVLFNSGFNNTIASDVDVLTLARCCWRGASPTPPPGPTPSTCGRSLLARQRSTSTSP